MITEKQIFDILNKYQSTGCILPNEKCIDPMDFHKIVNEVMLLSNPSALDNIGEVKNAHFQLIRQ